LLTEKPVLLRQAGFFFALKPTLGFSADRRSFWPVTFSEFVFWSSLANKDIFGRWAALR